MPAEEQELTPGELASREAFIDQLTQIRLSAEARNLRLSVDDEIKRREADLREWLANKVVPAFLTANKLTLAALGLLVVLDEVNLYFGLITPADRVIDSRVLMTLLGATTVQVGAIALAIGRYLFPSRSGGE